ncbi:hypothetical protein SETIT_8G040500v2 [Setaria italica]|uniref:Uncharacterized protein n=1 Tax=Setaria italica TaxID=4555 RepID=A0A368S402_SETIT|nr:uncharacterized protein LOC111258368 [Setaria italica]RCV37152.1 hypothetical protein SETIT_8G040500v2 [Setaria italica]
MANKLKLSGVCRAAHHRSGALLIGIQLGRALERNPDSASVSFSFRGALAYLAKELWGANNVLGLGRGRGRDGRVAQVEGWQPVVPASLVGDDDESSDMMIQSKHTSYIPLPWVEGRENSSVLLPRPSRDTTQIIILRLGA